MNHEIRYELKSPQPYPRWGVAVVARCTCGLVLEQWRATEKEAREKLEAAVELHARETQT
jgi:hypothetical protein